MSYSKKKRRTQNQQQESTLQRVVEKVFETVGKLFELPFIYGERIFKWISRGHSITRRKTERL